MKKSTKKSGRKTAPARGARGGRQREGQENVRSLVRTSGGKSYALTIPIEVIRTFRWKERQKLTLTIDPRRKTILIKDWKK